MKKFACVFVVLFALVGAFVPMAMAQTAGKLEVALSPMSPVSQAVLGGSTEVTVTVLKLTVTGEPINMEKLGLVFGGSNWGAISRITAWESSTSTLVGEMIPIGSSGTMILRNLMLAQDTETTIKIKVDVANVGLGEPAQIGDTFSVNYEAGGYNPTVGLGLNSGMPIYSSTLYSTLAPEFTVSGPAMAPIVVTYDATDVTKNSTAFNGWVRSNGMTTDAWFQYGTTYALGLETEGQRCNPDSNFMLVQQVPGLSSNTTYYFRVVAKSNGGTSYGAIMTFTTASDFASFDLAVVDSVTGQPFGQAWVYISSVANEDFYWNGWTDTEGKISLNAPSNALLVVHAADNGGHYGQYYPGMAKWEDAERISLPASITMKMVPTPIYCYPFNVTSEKIGPDGGMVKYGIYLENKSDRPKKFVLWATRSFPNDAPVSGTFYSGVSEAMEQRVITLAPGKSRVIYRQFRVLATDPDGQHWINFYLYNMRGQMINGGSLMFMKGENNTKG